MNTLRMLSSLLKLGVVTGSLVAGMACSSGSGDGDGKSPAPGTSSSSSLTCTEHHGCIGGGCTCSDGPQKDKSCCDPDDSSCAGTANACDQLCKVCK